MERTAAVDTRALLRRSEQEYDRLLTEYHRHQEAAGTAWDDGVNSESRGVAPCIREFVICVRASTATSAPVGGGPNGSRADSPLPDWLPVAELLLASAGDAADDIPRVLPHVCR